MSKSKWHVHAKWLYSQRADWRSVTDTQAHVSSTVYLCSVCLPLAVPLRPADSLWMYTAGYTDLKTGFDIMHILMYIFSFQNVFHWFSVMFYWSRSKESSCHNENAIITGTQFHLKLSLHKFSSNFSIHIISFIL